MAYEFHYTPTGTGVISGKEVLEQTEDAINDLGNTAISGVQEALDKAEQALTNSANAVDDAQTALNTANNAEGVAIQAQTDVGNLSGTVTNIGNRVTTAEGNISNLQGRMTTAEGNITNLQGRMTTAETNIGNLQTAVSTAQATANSAQQTATTARQQSYVFRYSGTAITNNSTIAYSTIDNTDNIKSGDKILDVDGKLFEITAVDTTNQTVTVGTALVDLALDANVVHTSGNETISGTKTFSATPYIYNSDSTAISPNMLFRNSKYSVGDTTDTGEQRIIYADKNGAWTGSISSYKRITGTQYLTFTVYSTDSNNANISSTLNYYLTKNGSRNFAPNEDSLINLGSASYRWKDIYATNYYYGANNVEFSTKFVTTDTNQTISGAKTFSEDIVINNSDTSQTTKRLVITSSKVNLGDNNSDSWGISFNAGSSYSALINSKKSTSSTQDLQFTVRTKDTNNALISADYRLRVYTDGTATIEPTVTDYISLGSSANRWSDVQTNLVNGLTPSSLSMPSDRSARVDISGYFTNMASGDTNMYTAPSNGWIYLGLNDVTAVNLASQTSGGLTNYGDYRSRSSNGALLCLFPIRSGDVFVSQWYTTTTVTVTNAYFIPCQGNV